MKLAIILICVLLSSFTIIVIGQPMLANIKYMADGYNSLYGQPVMEALKMPVWNFTWNLNRTLQVNGKNYMIPDQLNLVNDPSAASTSINQVFMTTYDVQTILSESYSSSFDPWFLPGMFSQSTQITNFQEHYYKYAQFTAISYLKITTWKATINNYARLVSSFINDLMDLPIVYNQETCPQFKTFFQKYGTHAFGSIIFGGTVTMSTSFNMEITKTKTVTEIQQDLNTQFFLMTYNGQLTEEQQQELDTLNAMYSSSFQLIGGKPGSFNQTQWQIWANTVPYNPVFVQFELIPFWEFLPLNETDNTNVTERMQALKNATEAYLLSESNYWQVLGKTPFSEVTATFTADSENIYAIDIYNLYAYDLRKNTWSTLLSPPLPATGMGMAIVDNYVFTIGGEPPANKDFAVTLYDQVYRYDLNTNIWTQVTSLPDPLIGMNVINLKDSFIIVGGFWIYDWEFFTSVDEVALYNVTTNKWQVIGIMPTPRVGCTSVLYNDTIYIFGGAYYYLWHYPPPIAQVDAYNLITGKWFVPTVMPNPLMGSSAVLVDNLIYIIGGTTKSAPVNTVYIYDPVANTWTKGPTLNVPKIMPGVASLSTGVYAIGSELTEVIVTKSFC